MMSEKKPTKPAATATSSHTMQSPALGCQVGVDLHDFGEQKQETLHHQVTKTSGGSVVGSQLQTKSTQNGVQSVGTRNVIAERTKEPSSFLSTVARVADSRRSFKRLTTMKRQRTQILHKAAKTKNEITNERRSLLKKIFESSVREAEHGGVARLVSSLKGDFEEAEKLNTKAKALMNKQPTLEITVHNRTNGTLKGHHSAEPLSSSKVLDLQGRLAECLALFPQVARRIHLAKQLYTVQRLEKVKPKRPDYPRDSAKLEHSPLMHNRLVSNSQSCSTTNPQMGTFKNFPMSDNASPTPFPAQIPNTHEVNIEPVANLIHKPATKTGNGCFEELHVALGRHREGGTCKHRYRMNHTSCEEEQATKSACLDCELSEKKRNVRDDYSRSCEIGIESSRIGNAGHVLNQWLVEGLQRTSHTGLSDFVLVQAALQAAQLQNAKECIWLGYLSLEIQDRLHFLFRSFFSATRIELQSLSASIRQVEERILPLRMKFSQLRQQCKRLQWNTKPRIEQKIAATKQVIQRTYHASNFYAAEVNWLHLVLVESKRRQYKSSILHSRRLNQYFEQRCKVVETIQLDKSRQLALQDNEKDLKQAIYLSQSSSMILQEIARSQPRKTQSACVQPNLYDFGEYFCSQGDTDGLPRTSTDPRLSNQGSTTHRSSSDVFVQMLRTVPRRYKPKKLKTRTVRKTVMDFLLGRLDAEKQGTAQGNDELPFLLYDYFIGKYRTRTIAERRLLDFAVSLSKGNESWWLRTFRDMTQASLIAASFAAKEHGSERNAKTKTSSHQSTGSSGRRKSRKGKEESAQNKYVSVRKQSASHSSQNGTGQPKPSGDGSAAWPTIQTSSAQDPSGAAAHLESHSGFELVLFVMVALLAAGSGETIVETKNSGEYWVSQNVAHDAVNEIFNTCAQSVRENIMQEMLRTMLDNNQQPVLAVSKKLPQAVHWEAYLKVSLENLAEMRRVTRAGFFSWFQAADLGENGHLSFQEVQKVVRALCPSWSMFQVSKLYRDSLRSGSNTAIATIAELADSAIRTGLELPAADAVASEHGSGYDSIQEQNPNISHIGPKETLDPRYNATCSKESIRKLRVEWDEERAFILRKIQLYHEQARTPLHFQHVQEHKLRVKKLEKLIKGGNPAMLSWCSYRLLIHHIRRSSQVKKITTTIQCVSYISKWKMRMRQLVERAGDFEGGLHSNKPGVVSSFVELLRARMRLRREKGEVDDHPAFSSVRWHRQGILHTYLNDSSLDVKLLCDRNLNTLLHVAAQNGHRDLVVLLIEAGIPLDAQNIRGQTALHFARMYGYKSIVHTLKKAGARTNVQNNNGQSYSESEMG